MSPTRLGSLVERNRDQIIALAARHKARSIAVFGSVDVVSAGALLDRDDDICNDLVQR